MKKIKKNIRKTRKIGLVGALNGLRLRKWYLDDEAESIYDVCRKHDVSCLTVGRINSKYTISLLSSLNPDLGASLGNGYIREAIYSVPRYGMINVHCERLPQYRNAQSIIWPIYFMDMFTGITVHKINKQIDSGNILLQDEFKIEFRRTLKYTVKDTIHQSYKRVPPMVRETCEKYQDLIRHSQPQPRGASYTTPTLRQYVRMVRNHRRMSHRDRLISGTSG